MDINLITISENRTTVRTENPACGWHEESLHAPQLSFSLPYAKYIINDDKANY